MRKLHHVALIIALINYGCIPKEPLPVLKISASNRFFVTTDGDPFFWLGDTGWLLFSKLDRQEAEKYLDDRKQKGFNVIQVMLLHTTDVVNVYGDSALTTKNVKHPKVTSGNSFDNGFEYDFWDHVDYVIDIAEEKEIHMAMVPVWGSNVKEGRVNVEQAKHYAAFLADRYKDRKNIVWMNGGDIWGDLNSEVWNAIGETLRGIDKSHLITFHPRGRTRSSTWFHQSHWLDFNMFQSGHRSYDQDTASADPGYGEDNWKYVQADYSLAPPRPTLDGEPSYEGIPQGLHDPSQPRWNDSDVRRYGYWSVFAGAAGFTYGNNSVMQMLRPGDENPAYDARDFWFNAMHAPGASQMVHLKNLMLSRNYFERIPDQTLVNNQGQRYDHIAATRGTVFAFVYTFNGRNIELNMGKIEGEKVKATWYDPRTGREQTIGIFENKGTMVFDPPGEKQNGNDWVLILDSSL